MKMKRKFQYFTNCTNIGKSNVDALWDMIDHAKQIKEETFFRHVDREEASNILGYNHNFRISEDRYIDYYKSTWKGLPCYYLSHSSIEYIFLKTQN